MKSIQILFTLFIMCLFALNSNGMTPKPRINLKQNASNTIAIFWEAIDTPYPQVVDLLFQQEKIRSSLKDWLGNSILGRALVNYCFKKTENNSADRLSVIQTVLEQKDPVVSKANIQMVVEHKCPKLLAIFKAKYLPWVQPVSQSGSRPPISPI